MGTLMELDPATAIHPGHSDPTTVGGGVGAQPVHPHLARPRPRGLGAVLALGAKPATLILLGPDYDGGHKALGALARRRRRHRSRLPQVHAREAAMQRPLAMPRENIPTSRVVRSATIGRLAAGQAVRQFGTRAANLVRDEEAADAALARRQVETAEQIVAVLGTMKGAAMKLGQVMSFLDVGLVPEEYREEFQRKLAELRDSAPKVSFKEMRKVIEGEFDDPLDEIFARVRHRADRRRLDRAGLPRDAARTAARSRSRSSTRASPSAVRADLKNLGMIMRLLSRMAPGLDVQAITAGDPPAHRRGARLRARGLQPARDGADLPRPPVRLRART